MKNVVGVGYKKANIYDFVRFFKCNGRNAEICSGTDLISGIFWPKDRCSNPPCHKCLGGTTRKIKRNAYCIIILNIYSLHRHYKTL